MRAIEPVAALLCIVLAAPSGAQEPKASTCLMQADKIIPIKPRPEREVYCGLDLGSRTVKLSVVSLEPGRKTSIVDERQCKRTLGMGALVFDVKTGAARPLSDEAIGYLSDTVREYQEICARDGGRLVAAGATQWARDATNVAEVRDRVKAATGVEFDVLSAQQEAEYSYVAAALDSPGRLVLDPGSNSFELAWREKRATTVHTVLVKYGYVRAAAIDFETASHYEAARAAYQAKTRKMIEDALATLKPPLSLAGLKKRLRAGAIGPEIVALGQDGAVHLAVRGLLRDGAGWVTQSAVYDQILGGQTAVADPAFGLLTAPPITPAEVKGYLSGLQPADLEALKKSPVRGIYGDKALVVPALIDLLFTELGASRLVMVPQEITTGHILAKLPR